LCAAGVFFAPCIAPAAERPANVVGTELPSTTIGGYVDTSAIWRIGGPSATGTFPDAIRLPGRLYDVPEKQDGFNLEAVSLVLDKPLDEGRWSAGYHVQLLMGPDVRLRRISAFNGTGGDVGVNEAYVSVRAPLGNGLDFRLGYFMNPLGFEVFDGYRNPNFSRSYGYFIEPKAHTGLTVEYQFAEWLRAMGGIANSYSPAIDARSPTESSKTYIGLITLTGAGWWRSDATLSLGYTGGNTDTAAPTDVSPRIHNFFAGARIPSGLQGLTFGLSYDYQANAVANQPAFFFFPAGPKSTYANAAAAYAMYQLAKWEFNSRVEYASGTAGYRAITSSQGSFGSTKLLSGPFNEEFLGITETIAYRQWANVIPRVEFRWDRDVSGGAPVFGTTANPRRNSLTLALNLIYVF